MDMCERVHRAIAFEQPDKVPLEIHYDMKTLQKYGAQVSGLMEKYPNHFLTVSYTPPRTFKGSSFAHILGGTDEWGVVWTRDVNQGIRVVGHPLENWDSLDDYSFPEIGAEGRFDLAEKTLKAHQHDKERRFVVGLVWFTFYERLWFLRGFNNCIMDIMRRDKRLQDLADRLMDFNMEAIKRTMELDVDAVFFSDDYGHQKGLIFPLATWRDFFLPRWETMFSAVHKKGAHTMLHSCGHIEPIIPHLIDADLDVLNPVQPQAMNVDVLGQKYRGRLCFFGGVDVQGTLPRGTEQDVEEEVKHLIWSLGDENGGYIGGTSHTILCDTPMENIQAMYNAFARWGDFSHDK